MPQPWPFTRRGTAVRLFLTCWIVYVLHSATNIAREHYLTFAIGDRLSFRVDEYQGLHPDLFETPGRGWHINSNPGASMMAALPYAAARPVITAVVERVQHARAAAGMTEPPAYDSPWPNSKRFFAEAWRRGLDVKFGLAALAIQMGFMAPASALAAVAMYFLLRHLSYPDGLATGLTLLYAFGTPVFFRTGYLNHNLLVGYMAFAGFLLLRRPQLHSSRARAAPMLAGVCGGAAVLLDYSGVVMLAGLFCYAAVRAMTGEGLPRALRVSAAFAGGAVVPLALLWFYQWTSFGDPFQPAQRWMPDVAWADTGYRGLSWPMPDLLAANLFDYRYGLFVSCPLMLLAFAAPWIDRGRVLPRRDTIFILLLFAAYWLFCGSVNYGRLQFNTGIRYMASVLPLLFLPAAAVLVRLRPPLMSAVIIITAIISWSLAMHRDVERAFGVFGAVLHILIGGFTLPALTTLANMGETAGAFVARGVSPLPLFALASAILWAIWRPGTPLGQRAS